MSPLRYDMTNRGEGMGSTSDATICNEYVPTDEKVTAVCISAQGSEEEPIYYLDHQSITATADKTIDLKPVKISLVDIEKYLQSL